MSVVKTILIEFEGRVLVKSELANNPLSNDRSLVIHEMWIDKTTFEKSLTEDGFLSENEEPKFRPLYGMSDEEAIQLFKELNGIS